MPYPLVAHQGIGAPFLLADRWRLDAVAFMVGTIAPDLPYALDRSRFDFDALGHRPLGLMLWALPVAVLLSWVFRAFVARPLAAHLPDGGVLRLRDVGFAATDTPGLGTVALSGLLGAVTHVVADGFTHPERWVTDRLPFLLDEAPIGLPSYIGRPTYWYDVLYWIADIGGAALLVACLYWAGRRRVQQDRPRPALPTPTPASRRTLWTCAAVGVGAGLAMGWSVLWIETVAQATMLVTWSVAAALVVGCVLADRAMATSPRPTPTAARPGSPGRPDREGACPCCGRS